MDWNLAIEKNRAALKRILAMLVAMAGLSEWRAGDPADRRAALTLPRHMHRFVLRLLRPAEAAARRLIIVAARGMVVELSPPRIAKPRPQPKPALVYNGLGQLVPAPPQWPKPPRARVPASPRALSLPLFDPFKRFGTRRRYVKQRNLPRISSFGSFDRPRTPLPPPLTPDDPLDAGRLSRRLQALASALDDLPRQAKRLARWQARRDAAIARDAGHGGQSDRALPPPPTRRGEGVSGMSATSAAAPGKPRHWRFSPMRPGRPPGWRRRPDHPVYEVLKELHGLAVWAMERPDTS